MDAIEYQLFKRILKGENEQLDFKFSIADGPKIARTISAFANTKGGSILVGVKDNKKIVGIRSEEDLYYTQKITSEFCRPPVSVETILYDLEGKEVLEIVVPSLIDKQLTLAPNENNEFIAYLRYEDSNHPAGAIFERVWRRQQARGIQHIEFHAMHHTLLHFFEQHAEPLSLKEIIQHQTFSRSVVIRVLETLIVTGHVKFFLTREGMKYVFSK